MWEHRQSKLVTLYLIITTLGILACDARQFRNNIFGNNNTNDDVPMGNGLKGLGLDNDDDFGPLNDALEAGDLLTTDIEIKTPATYGAGVDNFGKKHGKKVRGDDIPEEVVDVEGDLDDENVAGLEDELEGEPVKTSFFVKFVYGVLILALIAVVVVGVAFVYTKYCKFWIAKLKEMIAGKLAKRGAVNPEGEDAAMLAANY